VYFFLLNLVEFTKAKLEIINSDRPAEDSLCLTSSGSRSFWYNEHLEGSSVCYPVKIQS